MKFEPLTPARKDEKRGEYQTRTGDKKVRPESRKIVEKKKRLLNFALTDLPKGEEKRKKREVGEPRRGKKKSSVSLDRKSRDRSENLGHCAPERTTPSSRNRSDSVMNCRSGGSWGREKPRRTKKGRNNRKISKKESMTSGNKRGENPDASNTRGKSQKQELKCSHLRTSLQRGERQPALHLAARKRDGGETFERSRKVRVWGLRGTRNPLPYRIT